MKEQMKKHHGYQPETLPTHWNFTSYSTSNTLISWAHKTASRSHDSCWISTHWTYHRFFFSFFLFLKAFFLLFFLSSSCNSKNVSIPLFLLLSALFLVSMFLCYCSLFPLFLYYSSPTILHLTPYHINLLNHPHHSSLG